MIIFNRKEHKTKLSAAISSLISPLEIQPLYKERLNYFQGLSACMLLGENKKDTVING